jgi:hypothetical protein
MVASSLLAKNGINLMRTVRLELLERTHREVGALLLDDLYEERIELAGVRCSSVGAQHLSLSSWRAVTAARASRTRAGTTAGRRAGGTRTASERLSTSGTHATGSTRRSAPG